jgi:hypothetical protein
METEQVIRERLRHQVQEGDLGCNSQAGLPILDLGRGQPSLVQEGAEIEAGFEGTVRGQSSDTAGRTGRHCHGHQGHSMHQALLTVANSQVRSGDRNRQASG